MHAEPRGSEGENPPGRGTWGAGKARSVHGDYVLHRDEQQPAYPEPDSGAYRPVALVEIPSARTRPAPGAWAPGRCPTSAWPGTMITRRRGRTTGRRWPNAAMNPGRGAARA